MRLGTWEIIIVLVIVLLVFGPGRITKVAGEMGKGIKAFKDGLNEDKPEDEETEEKPEDEPKK
ncbi:MAG: sec-independent protein translocase protein TatA [Chloroflexota bacterium]|nr:sec-independent protein translocase protein TatA [Chloroflexota bacterium]